MSSTVYYQQVVPREPLGTCYSLKHLILDEANMQYGYDGRIQVKRGGHWHIFLQGYVAALQPGDDREALAEFLAALEEHDALEVWIDE